MPKITVLSWNAWNGEKLPNIISLLKDVGADVACCQEVSAERAEMIADALGQDYYHQGDVAIFSDFEIRDTWSKVIPAADRHAYIEIKVQAGPKLVSIGTVHLTYSRGFELTDERLAEGRYLLDLVDDDPKKYILTGDMNATPGSTIIKRLGRRLKSAGPDLGLTTWTTKPFAYQGFEADSLNWRLDYIFVSPDIKVVTSRIVETQFSDHLPVLAELEI